MGAGIGVIVGVAVGGAAVAVGVTGIETGSGVAVGVMMTAADEGTSGKAVASGVSGVSEGIIKSHAGRIARVNTMHIRNVNGVFFTA